MRGNGIVAAGFVLTWSSGFIGAALGARSASTFTLLMWRFLAAGVLLGGWWWLTRRRAIGPRELGTQAGIGLLSQGVYLFGVYWAVDLGVPSGTTALIAALQPIVATVLGQFVLGERASPAQWAGLALGLAGVALVVGGDLSGGGHAPPLAYALPVLAMLGLVAATLLERRIGTTTPLGDALVIQCVTSAAVFTGLAAVTGELVPPPTGSFWFAVAWVVVLSTFGGYGFYWLALRRTSVTRVSSLLYLTPPATMVLAFALFDERIDVRGLLGLAGCAVAVALVLSPRLSVPRGMMSTCCSPTSSPPPPR
ncbi:DMT family transporter [Amycolatopsis anabasis]|uniref:DMT family transporter n=1 Tax=Amycolatopsis anabasis TaxID=1840409 RepID=UPI00131DB467|nr:DMT family transporter [Amycolatopsis anabasis]